VALKIHELIEDIENKKYKIDTTVPLDVEISLMKIFKKNHKDMVCFDLGNIDFFDNFIWHKELIHLPYRLCWLEVTYDKCPSLDGLVRIGIHCFRDDNERFVGIVFQKRPEYEWKLLGFWRDIIIGGKEVIEYGDDGSDENISGTMEQVRLLTYVFLSVLNCSNVKRVKNDPSIQLQKARKKRGKLPLYSYWTLHIDLPTTHDKGLPHGGTHSSPRVHLRRGHIRRYLPGKWCWVQPCVVGNKSLGMVSKDYFVKHTKSDK
jgi:hypothetical protein